MSIGSLIYGFRLKYGHGLRVAYYRDIVRPRILQTPPVRGLDDERCEIHVLTSKHDWLNLIWVLKSFYHCSARRYRLCIHEDGSLARQELAALAEHFPDARIVDRKTADQAVEPLLRSRPTSQRFRRGNPLALKVFDFRTFLENDRMFLLDSDVLFFQEPSALIERIENPAYRLNCLNRDWGDGYTVRAETLASQLEFRLQSRVNSGLGLVHRQSMDFDAIEHWLGLPGVFSHPHRIEQTIIALASCRHGFEFLPPEYDVRIEDGEPTKPCRHYTGPIRHLMYSLGMRQLIRDGLLSLRRRPPHGAAGKPSGESSRRQSNRRPQAAGRGEQGKK